MSLRKAINEKWAEIDGSNERYFVSNCGRVKSQFRVLKQQMSPNGYWVVTIRKQCNGKPTTHSVHRLMALAFIPNPEDKPEVNHINGIKKDNRLENFEWVTKSEQAKHAWDNDLNTSEFHKRGIEHHKTKLDESDVIEILSDKRSSRILANVYGVSQSAIQHIKKRRSWKHITLEVNYDS